MKMTNKQFAVFLPVLVLTLVFCSVIIASAQATYGMWSIGNYAPSVSSCPAGAANSVSFCPVLPSGATVGTLYQSWNGGAWTVFGSGAASIAFSQITGTAALSQLPAIPFTQLTGQATLAQLPAIPFTQLSGVATITQIPSLPFTQLTGQIAPAQVPAITTSVVSTATTTVQ